MAEKLFDIIKKADDGRAQVKEIYEEIEQEVAADAILDGLTSVSKTSKYKLYHYVTAVINWIQQNLWDEKKAEIEKVLDQRLAPNDFWLTLNIKEFQFGDSLTINPDTGVVGYTVVDPVKQIIKRVAVKTLSGFYTAKVAKEDGAGDPIPLATEELTALNTFLDDLILGNPGNATSTQADRAKIEYKIYYKAERALSEIKADVEMAVSEHLKELDFRGRWFRSKLEDKIQNVTNVEDFEHINTEFRPDGGAFSVVTRLYQPISGYIRIDDEHPLANTLIYESI